MKLDHIKVIDFGEAVECDPSTKLTEISGTMSYVSRENLFDEANHNFSVMVMNSF